MAARYHFILLTFSAIFFGWACRKQVDLKGVAKFCLHSKVMPCAWYGALIHLNATGWIAVVTLYLILASAMPIQTLKTPRDFLTTIMMVAMIAPFSASSRW